VELLNKWTQSKRLINVLAYVIANYQINHEKHNKTEINDKLFTAESFVNRVFKFIRSSGMHSPYPYLYTNYGSADIPQGFSRISAVMQSLFIINNTLKFYEAMPEAKIADDDKIKTENNEISNFYFKTSLAGDKTYLRSNIFLTNKDYLPLFGLKELESKVEGSRLLRVVAVYEFMDKSYSSSGPKLYYVMPGNKIIKNRHPVQLFLADGSSSSSAEGFGVVYGTLVLSDESKEEIDQLGDNIIGFISEGWFKNDKMTEVHILKLKSFYLQKKRVFENEDALKTTKRLIVLDDDTFEFDMDEDFVEAEKHFDRMFEGSTKMELSKKIEEAVNPFAKEEDDPDDNLMNLLGDLDKMKLN
jgi:hypothetical protein